MYRGEAKQKENKEREKKKNEEDNISNVHWMHMQGNK